MKPKAVIVLSGGLDSTTCMGIAKDQGLDLYPITFHYGQRHDIEVEKARQVASFYEVSKHQIVDISFLTQIGGSALTDHSLDIPEQPEAGIPSTYVPARNLIFLSLATAYAEVINAGQIWTGVSAVDYSGYPDCRPEFIKSMNQTIRLATKIGTEQGNLELLTPLIDRTKEETIKQGVDLGVPYDRTTSCYKGQSLACGVCDSCRLRIKGFQEAGFKDPIDYAIPINW